MLGRVEAECGLEFPKGLLDVLRATVEVVWVGRIGVDPGYTVVAMKRAFTGYQVVATNMVPTAMGCCAERRVGVASAGCRSSMGTPDGGARRGLAFRIGLGYRRKGTRRTPPAELYHRKT